MRNLSMSSKHGGRTVETARGIDKEFTAKRDGVLLLVNSTVGYCEEAFDKSCWPSLGPCLSPLYSTGVFAEVWVISNEVATREFTLGCSGLFSSTGYQPVCLTSPIDHGESYFHGVSRHRNLPDCPPPLLSRSVGVHGHGLDVADPMLDGHPHVHSGKVMCIMHRRWLRHTMYSSFSLMQ